MKKEGLKRPGKMKEPMKKMEKNEKKEEKKMKGDVKRGQK
jgi:hypothetical protein